MTQSIVLTVIPAKARSTGLPNKNWEPFDDHGRTLVDIAVDCARAAGCGRIVISTDKSVREVGDLGVLSNVKAIRRPPELAQDDTPMRAVIKHALETELPTRSYDAVLVLQPTSPLRRPHHISSALWLLSPRVTSVVSVVEVLPELRPTAQVVLRRGYLRPAVGPRRLDRMPLTRQAHRPTFVRDGTIYLVRSSVVLSGGFYGRAPVPYEIQAYDSLSIDTLADWREALQVFRERR